MDGIFFMLNIIKITGKRSGECLCVICKSPYAVNDRFTAAKVHAGDQCPACKNLPNNVPTQALLHQLYDYDVATGKLAYKRDFHRRAKGEDPTSLTNNGYLVLTLDKTYLAHRIIWLMQTGDFPEFVDHIDHNRTNNQWNNLRDTSRQINAENKSVNQNNTTGYLGVSQIKSTGRYRASLTRERKQVHLGVFDTAEEANQARISANEEYGFHRNHGT